MTLFIFQKQYMFVYRAIMEMAQFGDTEVNAAEIKSVWQQLTDSSHSGSTVSLIKNILKKCNFTYLKYTTNLFFLKSMHTKSIQPLLLKYDTIFSIYF